MDIKITRKLLDNYRKTKRELLILEMELEEMRTTDAGLASSVIMDYRDGYGRPQAVVGFDQEEYDKRESVFERKKKEAEAVEKWINAIEDGQARYVFRMFYIWGMDWGKIAQKTGYGGNADYPRKMIRDRYFQKLKIK